MTAPVGADALAVVRGKIEDGYRAYGVLHRLLEEWQRVDRAGIPGAGRIFETPALKLDDDLDDMRIASIINLEQLALPFARAEMELYFVDPGHVTSATPGAELDRVVRSAASRCLAYGDDVAIWASLDDELVVEQSGAIIAAQPEPTVDARWHRRRVVFTNLLPSGALWVAGQDAGTLVFHPDTEDRVIEVGVRVRDGARFLVAILRLDLVRRNQAALHRITFRPGSSRPAS